MKPPSIRGFTLVELMVVIVIVAVIAALVLVNIKGVDYRKAMQAREILLMDLQRISREAQDQSKILALSIQSNQNNNSDEYYVVEYEKIENSQQKALLDANAEWFKYKNFKTRELPSRVSIKITPMDYRFEDAKNTILLNERAPLLIWLGNGEVKPVTIQFYYQQKPVGAEIQMDYLGRINEG